MTKTYTQAEVVEKIRKHTEETSLRRVAAAKGVSPGYLSDILKGNRAVSKAMANAFGFEREVTTTVVFHDRDR